MLMESFRAHCLAPGGSRSIWQYLDALMRSSGVSGRIACCFRTNLDFADVHFLPYRISDGGCTWSAQRYASAFVARLGRSTC